MQTLCQLSSFSFTCFCIFCICYFVFSRNLVAVQTVVRRLASRAPNVACSPLPCLEINDHDATQCILINCHDNPTIMPLLRQMPSSFGERNLRGQQLNWCTTSVLSYSEVGTQSVPWFSICGYFPINSFCFPSIYPDCSRRSQKTLFALSYACFVLYSYQSLHCEKWSVMDCNWESKMGGGATAPGLRLTLD